MTNAIYTQHCAKKFTHVIYVKMILLAGVATLGTRGFFLARRGASFRRRQAHTCLAEGPRHEQRSREKKPLFAWVTLRLNQNWKPCMESIWHPLGQKKDWPLQRGLILTLRPNKKWPLKYYFQKCNWSSLDHVRQTSLIEGSLAYPSFSRRANSSNISL